MEVNAEFDPVLATGVDYFTICLQGLWLYNWWAD